ncbi:MAG TPA: hypothetical protein VHO25_20665, partial [Polyangiaceae bacterium]|nr:hypothetical protein [Polyangiaceae bacterium]
NASVTVMGCTPFSDDGMTPLGTSIRVDLSQALGALSCGDAPGQVSSYQVSQRDSATAPISASCESTLSFDQLAANQTYFFDVLAFAGAASVDAAADNTQASDAQAGDAQASDAGLADAGASHASDATTADAASAPAARWRTTCYQQALSGVQQTAICEPLAPIP